MADIDYFGFLPIAENIKFSSGQIVASPEITSIIEKTHKLACQDGFIYPPLLHGADVTSGYDPQKSSDIFPPIFYCHVPTTHSLEFVRPLESMQDARRSLSGFIIHFLGFLYGYRIQFYDWWFDGRIQVKSTCTQIQPRSTQAAAILDKAIKTWLQWGPRKQQIATNILYLHSKTPSYKSDWERFQTEYQIIDAICFLANVSNHSHSQRIKKLCEKYSIIVDNEKFEAVKTLRNDLFHEALWEKGMLGDIGSHTSINSPNWLHKISKRAIFAVLGINGKYVESDWQSRWPEAFDISMKN
ncbi:hypothetical protein [uncultured Desulfuromusa sp.]|uniref:hypothetical protein n=1 Tax=uncultured Desulfuromusa sp. TaxID=219183 RepID=UPI002AA8D8B1|nr:hypothetical protein [uncultured Desulfuromusa sp.]